MGKFALPKLADGVTEHPDQYVGALGEVTFDAATRLTSTHDGETPGGNTLVPANFNGRQDLVISPVANPDIVTRTSSQVIIETEARNEGVREFGVVRSMISRHGWANGGSIGGSLGGKVLSYDSAIFYTGSGDGWLRNGLMRLESTNPINLRYDESDGDIICKLRYGDQAGPAGMAGGYLEDGSPFEHASAWFYTVTGVSKNGGMFTGGFLVAGAGLNNLVSRGFVTAPGIKWAAYADYSSAFRSFEMWGNNTFGLDTSGGNFSGAAIIVGHLQRVQAYTVNGDRKTMIRMVGESLDLGHDDGINAVAEIRIASSIRPAQDNTIPLGREDFRFSAIWAGNGLIQQSDPTLKMDMERIDPEIALKWMKAVGGWQYRWKVGGYDTEEVMVPGKVQKTEIVKQPLYETVLKDGNATRVITGYEDIEKPVFDRYPRVDEAGNPVMTGMKGRRVQEFIDVPVMIDGMVPEVRYTKRAGARLHRGVNADEIEAAQALIGQDFGGFVVDADGVKNVRYDQLIPFAYEAIRYLIDRVEALERAA